MATIHQKLKKKAWRKFSEYIRKRDVGDNGFGTCATCRKVLHWKQGQAGHFEPGRTNMILFDKRNCHLQCVGCNFFGSGKAHARYYKFMLEKYGQKVINEIEKNALINDEQLTDQDLLLIIQDCQNEIDKLEAIKTL
jgi:hypothetical protein